ncbi:MAG: heavy metal translocating P-type ATPase metal-binding domain-containing protein [Flavobacteriia bacterium]|nr:heavy metal translocating P-type ATPase metal-binding domain-containing protein [Flavobacteriia bacterium]
MSESLKCDHCGVPCTSEITLDDKVFCCHGCKSVYTILWANGMESFYSKKDTSGKPVADHTDFSFLENEEIRSEVMDFSDGKIGVVRLFLPAIHCSACLWLLERLHKLNEAVISVRVEFSKRTAHIRFRESDLSLVELAELLQQIGYPPHIRLADAEGEGKAVEKDKRLIYQFGIAAFAFGNIMLMALPEYFYPNDNSFAEYSTFFRWLSWVLTLPVVFYSARDYFTSAYRGIRIRRVNIDQPIAIGILALFLQSTFEISVGVGSGYLDSLAGLIFFLLLGKLFQRKTYESLSFERDYKSYFPLGITVINKDESREIKPVQKLERGELIYIRNEEIIPVDGKIIRGDAVIDNAFVTGESTPEKKRIGDHVFAGGKQCGGAIEVLVERPMDQSYLTQLWNDQNFDSSKGDKFQTLTDRVSKYFVAVILALAVGAFAFWTVSENWVVGIKVFTAVLIVACPCALALSAPFANGHALRLMGRKGLYLKRAEVVESLADVNHIVWDKTGTLTSVTQSTVEWVGNDLTTDDKAALSTLMHSSKHPLSLRISSFLGNGDKRLSSFEEIVGKGVKGTVDGVEYKLGSSTWLGADSTNESNVSQVWVKRNAELIGHFLVRHSFRPETKIVVNQMKQWAGQTVVTGDDNGEESALRNLFGVEVDLKFRQKPIDKLNAIAELQASSKQVAMIGDGLNDAGALNQAEVGISVAEDINNFTPASDAILHVESFSLLPQFFKLAKYTRAIIYWSFGLSFAYNIAGLTFALLGMLSPLLSAILMPLSSITIVTFVSLTVNRFRFN